MGDLLIPLFPQLVHIGYDGDIQCFAEASMHALHECVSLFEGACTFGQISLLSYFFPSYGNHLTRDVGYASPLRFGKLHQTHMLIELNEHLNTFILCGHHNPSISSITYTYTCQLSLRMLGNTTVAAT
jgi:hypothetical protein